ncbi:hypothetical protein BZA77DRAFT_301668 [Pyronema omphalodes]|nr:hypothetical protein BZA77DRAFT_301668 [Pyronema omphalodes]
MALSLLSRRRSNPNLRKAYVAPVDEESSNRASWAFNESLIDSDYAPPAQPRRSSTIKSSAFKFTLPVRGPSRAVLRKGGRDDQPRRATVTSVTLEKEIAQVSSVWNELEARDALDARKRGSDLSDLERSPPPRSSQSTLPGENQPDHEAGNDSIFSRESGALNGAPSPAQGGLFPRPASLQRHWSESREGRERTDSAATGTTGTTGISGTTGHITIPTPSPAPGDRLSQLRMASDPDRIRPLSFSALSSTTPYSLKITEAAAANAVSAVNATNAALENRVKVLETQVSDLRSIIADGNWSNPRQSVTTNGLGGLGSFGNASGFPGNPSFPGSSGLGTPGSLGNPMSPGVSFSNASNSDATPQEENLGLGLFDQVSPRGSIMIRDREKALSALEGLHHKLSIDTSTTSPTPLADKRATVSTIRGPSYHRDQRASVATLGPAESPVSMAEYSAMISLVKKEQKARRKLESQIQALQEQMAAVLHRQLMAESRGVAMATPSSARRFEGFDGVGGSEGDADHDHDHDQSDDEEDLSVEEEMRRMGGLAARGVQLRAESRMEHAGLERTESGSTFGGDGERTMSLSQLTTRGMRI